MIFNFKKSDAEIFTSKIIKACKHSKLGGSKALKTRLGLFFHQVGVDWHSHLVLNEIMESFRKDDPYQPNLNFFPFENELCRHDKPIDITKRCYETAVAFIPSHSESYYNLGTIEQRIGNEKQAIKHFKKVTRLGPSQSAQEHAHVVANAYWRIADFFLHNNEKREALEYFELAISKLGAFGTEHEKYAKLLRQLDKVNSSARQYESLMNYSHRYSPEFILPFSKIVLPFVNVDKNKLINPFETTCVFINSHEFIFFAGLFLSYNKNLLHDNPLSNINTIKAIKTI